MINQGMGRGRDFHNVGLDTLQGLVYVFHFVCEHLGEGAGGEAGLFSVDSSDPPISSGPL